MQHNIDNKEKYDECKKEEKKKDREGSIKDEIKKIIIIHLLRNS